MAGISYTLKSLLKEDRYMSDFKANLYSLVISSGPWIFAVLCITALLLVTGDADDINLKIFRAIIVYVYAFSLIFSGFFQLILTRFISDKLYQREYSSLLPNFFGVSVYCGILSFVVSSVYMYFTELNFLIKVMTVIFFCISSYQWIIMVFLSSVRDYVKTTLTFFFGFVLSFFASYFFGHYIGLTGYLGGFIIGQIVILLFLTERLTSEFPLGQDDIFEFTRYFNKYPYLFWAAFLYNLGYWIDKIILWTSPLSQDIAHSFRYHYPYDTAVFLAALTTIPAMAMFFLQVETEFYDGLRSYINKILNKGTYDAIEKKRQSLSDLLRIKLVQIMEFQLLITIVVCLLAPKIVSFLGFNAEEIVPVFVVILVASFFQIMFLIFIVLFWYLELLKDSVLCCFLFTLLNGIFTYIQIYHTDLVLGTGYLLAIVISFTVALIIMIYRMKDLNYLIFVKNSNVEERIIPMPRFDA